MNVIKIRLHKRYLILAEELYNSSGPNKNTPYLGEQRRSRLIGAIVFLGFALESFINEIGLEYCKDVFDSIDRLSPADKLIIILKSEAKRILEKGREPYQSISLIFRLRNQFAHFKPQFKGNLSKDYIAMRDIDHKLVKKLYNSSIDGMKFLSKEFGMEDNDWLEDKKL